MRASVSWWSSGARGRRRSGSHGEIPARLGPLPTRRSADRRGAPGADAGLPGHRRGVVPRVRDWPFLLGPGVMTALNALSLGTLMYPSGLVPRAIPLMGLIGAPLLLPANLGTMFGVNDEVCL